MSDEQQRPLIPPVLYVPVRDASVRANDITIDFLSLHDGRIALAVYSALDRLVRGCGAKQSWATISTSTLDEINKYQPYDVILLDADIRSEQQVGGVRND